MAKSKAGKAGNVVIWILMGLLILSLGGFGITQFNAGMDTVGQVGGKEVTVNQYAQALNQALANIRRQTGQNVTLQQAAQFRVPQQVMTELLGAAALDNEAEELGISAGDQRVANQIGSIGSFQSGGQFDVGVYRNALRHSGTTPKDFEAQIRAEIARSILDAAIGGGVQSPTAATDSIMKFVAEEHDISFIVLEEDALAEPIGDGSDADYRAFYGSNTEDYQVPETRKITYLWLDPETLAENITPDEDDLLAAYESRKDEFNIPERRMVERLVFASAEDAEAANARLQSGEIDFPGLVSERGLELADIELGALTVDDLGVSGAAVFAEENTGVTGVVDSPLGPAIFRINAILFAQVNTFDDVRDQLVDIVGVDEARNVIADLSVEIDDLLASGATLEEIASETGSQLGQVDYHPNVTDGIAGLVGFRTAAAAASVDDFPEIGQLEGGGAFALRLNAIEPARDQTFEEARDAVKTDWRENAVETALTIQGQTLIDAIESGADITALDLPVQTESGLVRSSILPSLPANAMAKITGLEEGQIASIGADGRVYIVQVTAKSLPSDDEEFQSRRASIEFELSRSLARDIYAIYSNALQAEAGISLNQHAINAVHAQFP